MPTFESRDDAISKLVSPERSVGAAGWNAWRWEKLVRDLDQAGYIIMRKPRLMEKGKPKPRPYV